MGMCFCAGQVRGVGRRRGWSRPASSPLRIVACASCSSHIVEWRRARDVALRSGLGELKPLIGTGRRLPWFGQEPGHALPALPAPDARARGPG